VADSATGTNNIDQAPAINPSRNIQLDLNIEPATTDEIQGNQSDSSHIHTVGNSKSPSSSSEDSSSDNESDNDNVKHSDEENSGNEQNEVFPDSAINPVQHSHVNTQYDEDDDEESDPELAHIGSKVPQKRTDNSDNNSNINKEVTYISTSPPNRDLDNTKIR